MHHILKLDINKSFDYNRETYFTIVLSLRSSVVFVDGIEKYLLKLNTRGGYRIKMQFGSIGILWQIRLFLRFLTTYNYCENNFVITKLIIANLKSKNIKIVY